MLYRPCHDRLWDTWLVHDAGLWHLFYIRISRDHPGLWNGISLATSSDLVHFSEQGPILDKTEIATWVEELRQISVIKPTTDPVKFAERVYADVLS